MKTSEWSVARAALYGAAFGAVVAVVPEFATSEGLVPKTTAGWVALMIGGAMGGMFLFALVAVVRNFWAR